MHKCAETTATPLENGLPADHSISRVNPLQDPQWDSRISDLGGVGSFHGAAWAHVLHEAYKFEPVYFASKGKAEYKAILPVMEVDSWLTGRRGISLPFADECEPVGEDDSRAKLVSAALCHAKSRNWGYCEFRGGKDLFNVNSCSIRFWGHRLDLTADTSSLFAGFNSSARTAVRKAEQCGVTVDFSTTPAAVRTFYELFCNTRKRHGVPPPPWRFFESIQRHVLETNQGFVALARRAESIIAGAIFFFSGNIGLLKFSASDSAFQHLRGNNLVMWHAIQRLAKQRLAILDFGRTSVTNEGLRRFKLSWGTQERLVEYFRYSQRTGDVVPTPDKTVGWPTTVLTLLPAPIFRLIGSAVYRHMA
jgi:hypothetical protein